MQNKNIICADAATENCPCMLAETGDCLICSRLQGKNECGCDWAGVCVYNEFIQNNRKRALTRAEKRFMVSDVKRTSDGSFIIMDIACGRGIALSCLSPGTHIFIRPAGCERYYDVPLSVLRADHTSGVITVCFRVISAKTKALAECRAGCDVIVRGPYRNGIKGLPRGLYGKNILIATAGAGVAPAVHAAGLLAAHNDIEIALCNAEAAEHEIVDGYLRDGIPVSDVHMCSYDDEISTENEGADVCGGTDLFYRKLHKNSFDTYILLGSTGFISAAAERVREYAGYDKNVIIAVSNNSVMCCGEGICGACGCVGAGGGRVPGCKCAEALF